MRMKKLLMFLVLLTVSVGTWAASVNWSQDGLSVTGSNMAPQGSDTYQLLTVSGPGALGAWINATKDQAGNELDGVGGNSTRVHLRIDGTLNADDLAALNSSNVARLGTFTSLDLQNATIPSIDALSSMNMANMQHLLLPCGYEGDANAFKSIKTSTNNTSLKLVASTDAITNAQSIAIYSFEANNVFPALGYKGTLMHQAGDNAYQDVAISLNTVKTVRMAGIYGDKDLSSGYNSGANFGGNPAVWDFTGADFAPCTLSSFTFANGATHYAVDDPFQDPERNTGITSLSNYSTNAFCYFTVYAKQVVDITLPTEIDVLPPGCLLDLATNNKENYKTINNLSEEQFASQFSYVDQNGQTQVRGNVPMETLTIPDNYTTLDYECALRPNIKHLVVGSGLKEARGGAFANSTSLEDLDFAAGLSNCKIGDLAFGESHSMKHIALSEGIVSIGVSAFANSQHLESIRLPQSLLYMGNDCFNNCLALNSITIPENVKQIGQRAFVGCPFTDIYLTTTDPENIPLVWSAGTKFEKVDNEPAFDPNCTFNHGHLDGWGGGVDSYKDIIDGKMTWEEATPFYFINWNGMPVLHFPEQLAEKVRSDISSSYAMKSADDPAYGLPLRTDINKRDNIPGLDLGTDGQGKYTKDGWAQFMLMKEFSFEPGGDVYQKEYDDVWYTMCFPFDLSDEQLATAFNETFNIVDFSGVEVVEANEEAETPLTLILHFNNVAMTDYKDTDDNHYKRKLDNNGKVIREKDQTSGFEYNVYTKDGKEYHHVVTAGELAMNKTKTFAEGTSMANAQANFNSTKEAFLIDGILATAGHPYMIHPAIGVNDGGTTKRNCSFSGVEWAAKSDWAELFTNNSRTIDLGIKKTLQELPDSNYNQAAYSKYAGQKYTFIGNSKEYRDGAQTAIGDEPQVPDEPVFPVAPDRPTGPLTEPTVTVTKPTPLTDEEQALVLKLTEGNGEHNRGPWYGITESITASFNDGSSPQWNSYVSQFHIFSSLLQNHGYNVYNASQGEGNAAIEAFNWCKTTFNKSINYASEYAAYLANQALWDDYHANQAAWAKYNSWNQATEEAEYYRLLGVYNAAKGAHNTWLENAKKWKTYIPKNAYFLGRKGTAYPKYYREIAENPADNQPSTRQGGAWTQFTAIIIPNAAAVNGIEKELDGGVANNTKGLNMVFNEDFEGEFDATEIKEIVAEAEEKGQKVEYMNIVYSINGEIVGRGSQSLSNLPQGMYIINGKKYLVK